MAHRQRCISIDCDAAMKIGERNMGEVASRLAGHGGVLAGRTQLAVMLRLGLSAKVGSA